MIQVLKLGSRTYPGPFLGGLAGALGFTTVVGVGIWMGTGRNSNPESRIMAGLALASATGLLISLFALATWGQYLARILSRGDSVIGKVQSISRGKDAEISVAVPSGHVHRVIIAGEVSLTEGQTVTLRSPAGKTWPLLIQEGARSA